MKSFSLKLIFVSALAFAFAIQTNAQLCGKYSTTLQIKTAEGKPIENAVIQLLPIEKDETKGKTFARDEKDYSKFSIWFFEGHQLTANYKLMISADGFKTLEKKIRFPHCERQTFEMQLEAKSQTEPAILSGTVFDDKGAVIPQTKISFTDSKGKVFKTFTNDDGVYSIELSEGKYKVEFNKENFSPYRIENYYIPFKTKMYLDISLEVGTIIDTITVSPKRLSKKN